MENRLFEAEHAAYGIDVGLVNHCSVVKNQFLLFRLLGQNVAVESMFSLDFTGSGKGEPFFGTGVSFHLRHNVTFNDLIIGYLYRSHGVIVFFRVRRQERRPLHCWDWAWPRPDSARACPVRACGLLKALAGRASAHLRASGSWVSVPSWR